MYPDGMMGIYGGKFVLLSSGKVRVDEINMAVKKESAKGMLT